MTMSIYGGEGNNQVAGGFGKDTITTLSGADRILGDNGHFNFIDGVVVNFRTSDTLSSTGDDDTIDAGEGRQCRVRR